MNKFNRNKFSRKTNNSKIDKKRNLENKNFLDKENTNKATSKVNMNKVTSKENAYKVTSKGNTYKVTTSKENTNKVTTSKENKSKDIRDESDELEKECYIYGTNVIYEALCRGNDSIQKIFVLYGDSGKRVGGIVAQAKRKNVNCVFFDKKKFRELEQKYCPQDAKTQGVIALRQIVATLDLEDFISTLDISKNPVLVILDGITDIHNLGAIARSAECAGVSALILPINDSAPITPTAIKTSAGALNYINVIRVQNLILTIEKLKEFGFWIVGTDIKGDEIYYKNIYNKPTAIIIGSEGKGISPSLVKHCDHLIRINMYGKINSLNASVAAGIIFFEIQRQKHSGN